MRFVLNGQFTLQNVDYWRVDDMDSLQREMEAGTYDPFRILSQFGIAINAESVPDAAQARRIVDAINREVERG